VRGVHINKVINAVTRVNFELIQAKRAAI